MRGQVSILIILGVFIIVIFLGGVFIMMSSTEENLKDEVQKVRGLGTDAEQIISYANSCFENIITEGLFLMGSQGGYIYRSQGGRSFDYEQTMEGVFFVDVGGVQVPYRIANPIGVQKCSSVLPEYPVNQFFFTYPYVNVVDPADTNSFLSADKEYIYKGCFGKAIKFDTRRSLEDIRHYIVNHIDECDFSSFTNFDFNLGQADATVEFSREKTIVEVLYPMSITNVNTGAKGDISKFRVDIKLSLDELFDIVNDMITNDISDPKFDIDDLRNDDVVVYVDNNIHGKDDLIKVSSKNIMLNGKEFELRFIRRNRPPALEYVYDTTFDLVTMSNPSLIVSQLMNKNKLNAVDPDEDKMDIVVIVDEFTPFELFRKTINLDGVSSESIEHVYSDMVGYGELNIKVSVSDGEFEDYQISNEKEDFIVR